MQQRAGTAEGTEPAIEDIVDVAAAIDLNQRAIHREAKVGIVARQHQGIRLEREIALKQCELGGIGAAGAQ